MIDTVYASTSATVPFNGAQVAVHKGSHWPVSDPLVQQYPHLFSRDPRFGMLYTREPEGYDVPTDTTPVADVEPVEQATAAPGERRSTRRRTTPDIEF